MKYIISQLFFGCLALFVLLTAPALAQTERIVSGTVTDSAGNPVIGASVVVPGTTLGTSTGVDGRYTLHIGNAEQLQISFVGYIIQTEKIGSRSVIDVILKEDAQTLDDVVVVGYGTMKRSDLTGAAVSVKADDLIAPATASVGSMLQGKAAGLNIQQTSAKPGGSLDFSIRGQKAPLIIVDGVPQTSFAKLGANSVYDSGTFDSQMISLNPEDIESVDILKDASSTAIYGADAAGGVILITTKKGKASQQGHLDVAYSGSVSVQRISDFPEFLNAKDFMIEQNKVFYELDSSVGRYSRHSQEKIDSFRGEGTRWIDEVTRTGVVQEHNLSIRSGNDHTQYAVSGSYYDNKGIAKNNDMTRMTGRLVLDQQFTKWLKGGINAAYTHIKYNNVPLGDARQEKAALIYSAMTFNPLVPVYDENGEFSDNPDRNIYSNPVSLLEITDENINNNLSGNAYLQFDIFEGLNVKTMVGIDSKDTKMRQYIPRTTKAGAEKNGIATKNEGNSQMLMSNVIANYNRTFGGKHALGVMAGWEYRKNSWDGTYVTASNFPTDTPQWNNLAASEQEKPYLSSYKGSSEFVSFISRVTYSYDERYFLTANLRVDGSSNFSAKKQYGTFMGVSAAWRLSQERFLKDVDWISNLKLRAGWGQVGNAGSLTGIYTYYAVWPNAYAFNGAMSNGVALSALGNPNLTWQTATDINIGLDLGFLRNRIAATIDIYQRVEKDIIGEKSLMSYNEIKTINYNSDEKWRTRGIDISINTVNVDTRNFTWKTDFNISYYRTFTIARDKDFTPSKTNPYKLQWGDVYKYRSHGLIADGEIVQWMPNGQAGNIKYCDLGGYALDSAGNRLRDSHGGYIYTNDPDGVLDEADMYCVGNTTPIPFGFNNSFRYKNWDLNVYIYGSFNGLKVNELLELCSSGITDMTYGLNALADVKKRWSPDNPEGTLPSVSNATSGVATSDGDFYYENAWYARLDNISLGYTFRGPRLRKFCNSIRLYAAVKNVCVLTPYNGMDPETGVGIGAYPNQRTYTFGLNLNF